MLILVSLFLPSSASAGGCEESRAERIALLKKVATGEITKLYSGDGPYCLMGRNRYWDHSWATKSIAEAIARRRVTPIPKIEAVCLPALSHGPGLAKQICLALLADHGKSSLGEHSVFDMIPSVFPCGLPLTHLAALGGEKAARAAEAQWTQGVRSHCGANGCECIAPPKRGKRRRTHLRNRKKDVLNALWHIRDPGSQMWLEKVAFKDPSKKIRKFARTVHKRIMSGQ